jgi:hypothetical protein
MPDEMSDMPPHLMRRATIAASFAHWHKLAPALTANAATIGMMICLNCHS